MADKTFDIIILGGGPAGLSAAIYAARSAAKTAIIDISMLGGQPSNYLELENYPGFAKIGGYDLMENLKNMQICLVFKNSLWKKFKVLT